MKKHISKIALLAFVCFALVGCQKENVDDDGVGAFTLGEDASIANELIEEAAEEAANKLEPDASNTAVDECPTVTFAQEKGTYPNTVTIDFGDGCEDKNGRIRTGRIIVEVSDYWKNEGAVREVRMEDMYVDGMAIEGTRKHTNLGQNEEGLYQFSVEIDKSKVSTEEDRSVSMSVDHLAVMLEGYDTDEREDDVFSVTGTSSGVNHRGHAFSAEVIEPLIRKKSCKWFVEGVEQITIEGKDIITMDFGDGECDEFAEIDGPKGTKTIKLRR